MKKLSLLLVMLLLSLSGIDAQQNKMKISSRADKDAPTLVLADAADPDPSGHKPLSRAEGEEEKIKKDLSAQSLFTFVEHRGKGYWKKVTYKYDGTMVHSIERRHNVALPKAVYKSIGREYNGWQINKTAVVKEIEIRSNAPQHSTYYKVHLQNGKDKERILLDEHGKIYSRK